MNRDDLRRAMRLARQTAGLTLQQVADRAGVSITTVHAWEIGRADLKAATLFAILSALGLTLRVEEAAAAERPAAPEGPAQPPATDPPRAVTHEDLAALLDQALDRMRAEVQADADRREADIRARLLRLEREVRDGEGGPPGRMDLPAGRVVSGEASAKRGLKE